MRCRHLKTCRRHVRAIGQQSQDLRAAGHAISWDQRVMVVVDAPFVSGLGT
jgi:hypothetical protein